MEHVGVVVTRPAVVVRLGSAIRTALPGIEDRVRDLLTERLCAGALRCHVQVISDRHDAGALLIETAAGSAKDSELLRLTAQAIVADAFVQASLPVDNVTTAGYTSHMKNKDVDVTHQPLERGQLIGLLQRAAERLEPCQCPGHGARRPFVAELREAIRRENADAYRRSASGGLLAHVEGRR